MPIIAELKSAREAKRQTRRTVAEQIGVHANTIRYAEKGTVSPSIDAVEAWAGALGMKVVLVQADADILATPLEAPL